MIPVQAYVLLAAALFCIGVFGLLTTRSALRILVNVELIANAANINFAVFAQHHGHADGLALVLFVLAIAAAEAAVGLGIFIHLYRHTRTIDVDRSAAMRW